MAKVLMNTGSSGISSSNPSSSLGGLHHDQLTALCGSPPRTPTRGSVSARAQQQQQQQRGAASQQQHQQQALGGLNFYTTLGLRPGSSQQDVKRAYRRLALKYHPDVCKGDHCAPRFKQINAAYEGLNAGNFSDFCNSYADDDDEEEEWGGGWEGAWMF